jgi:leucine dehydrogenase
VRGIPEGGVGDPSPHTAYGVFCGLKATAATALGSDDLSDVGIAVQGLGNVGMGLARHLHEAGARLVVADIREAAVERAVSEFGAEVIAPDRAHAADVEIFSPCALGAVLNARTIPEMRARAIAGSANNQLETGEDGERLMRRDILYAPDYAINAGGVIAIGHEGPDFDAEALKADLERIGATLARIFARSSQTSTPTVEIARALAMERLDSVASPLASAAATSV